MTASAAELARELAQLQQEFRAYSQTAGFRFSELSRPAPGGFIERYRQRTTEIQQAIAGIRLT